MLPPGHIAAGFLTATALLHFTYPDLTASQQSSLLLWGMFFGAAPDFDLALNLFKLKSYRIVGNGAPSHRKYLSHAPVLWLIAGLAVYFLSPNDYYRALGLLVWLGSFTHFVLDSVDYGIMWLWPFNTKFYSFRNPHKDIEIGGLSFIGYLWSFTKIYSKALTFYLEIIVIVSALIILISTKY
jgi:membrane-bound metal-dependent hydrolase YbcI (DUF457 family)